MEPTEPEGIRHGLGKATGTSNIPAINTLPASGSELSHAGISRTNMERLFWTSLRATDHIPERQSHQHMEEERPTSHGPGGNVNIPPWNSTMSTPCGSQTDGRTRPKNTTPALQQ